MSGQHRAGEVVEAPCACLAPILLPVSLGLIKAVSDHGTAAACGAVDTLRPAMLAYQGEALGILDQCREIDQIRYRHVGESSPRVASSRRPHRPSQRPCTRATQISSHPPEPHKSHRQNFSIRTLGATDCTMPPSPLAVRLSPPPQGSRIKPL